MNAGMADGGKFRAAGDNGRQAEVHPVVRGDRQAIDGQRSDAHVSADEAQRLEGGHFQMVDGTGIRDGSEAHQEAGGEDETRVGFVADAQRTPSRCSTRTESMTRPAAKAPATSAVTVQASDPMECPSCIHLHEVGSRSLADKSSTTRAGIGHRHDFPPRSSTFLPLPSMPFHESGVDGRHNMSYRSLPWMSGKAGRGQSANSTREFPHDPGRSGLPPQRLRGR